jgi:hypothetical protein
VEPRELVLRELRESPWLQQRELAARLSEETGMAESTLIRLFRRMEADGELQSGLDGRRRTYALAEPVAEPAPEPTPGALWSRRLEALGEPEPEPEEPEPEEPEPDEPEPEPAPPQPPAYTRPAWPFAAVVAAVVAFAVIAAIALSPSKPDPLTGAEQQQEETRPAGR